MVLGAAIGAAVPNIPSWSTGNNDYSAGGVLEAMLHPVGGFGKFVSVLLAFSLLGNLAAAMYSISLNFQLVIPIMARVPRLLFTIVYTIVAIPVSICAANSFFDSLENFLYVIAYWSAAFVGVVATEHFVFHKADCDNYNPEDCDNPSQLPTGAAAVAAIGLSFGLIVPCMSQIWYTGPLAKTTGDLGFEIALVLSPLLYLPLRYVELRFRSS
jgi:purine-cytosine permease-like protein